ncbi:MATE family efflux transporter [Defluviitalea phaphyphila]|uniref:MATE family efflux transporter n=1 Tax=Defluviitalea phaphyphila TaxID=1473580 RepID=UPI000731545E|nr:MATE family efflux transporter [Defluviitalea phaphyphila]
MKNGLLKRRDLIINGSMWKTIILLAIPVAINNFINAAYNLIDTLFVSYIGSMELAAITFVGPINNLIRAISDGLAIGETNLVGREIGRGDYEKAKTISSQFITISLILGVIVTFFCYLNSRQILISASATQNLIDTADIYFKLTVLSTPLIFINSSFLAIKRANAETLKAMIINFIAIIFKIISTYIMIFHMNLGIKSLAIATLIGNMVVSIYAIYDLFLRKSFMQLKISLENLQFEKKVFKLLFIIAIPIMVEKSSISYSFLVVNKYVLNYGEKVLAGYGVTNRINSLLFSCVAGFGTGLSAIISQNLGANQQERVRDGIKKTMTLGIVVATVIISIILFYRYDIASIFAKKDDDILYHTVNAMSVYSISVIPWAIFQVIIGVFQGTGHTQKNLFMSVARVYLFRVPLVIALSKLSHLQEYSIWYAMLFSNILTAVLALILYAKSRKNLKLVGE